MSTPEQLAQEATHAAAAARIETENRLKAASILSDEVVDRRAAIHNLAGTLADGNASQATATANSAAQAAGSAPTPIYLKTSRWGGVVAKAAPMGCLAIFVVLVLVGGAGAAFFAAQQFATTQAAVAALVTTPVPTEAEAVEATPSPTADEAAQAAAPVVPTNTAMPTPTATATSTPTPLSTNTPTPTTAPKATTQATATPDEVAWGSMIHALDTFGREGNEAFTAEHDVICWGAERQYWYIPAGRFVPAGTMFSGGCGLITEFYENPQLRLYSVGLAQDWHDEDEYWTLATLP